MRKTVLLMVRIFLIVFLFLVGFSGINAHDGEHNALNPVVFAVLYFSPTCPHCHEVIDNHVPKWDEEFGDSLHLLFVDVTQQGGGMLLYATCDALGVESCGSVPMLVIGETFMIGSADIPARAPDLIREGLAGNGIALPPVVELQQAYAQMIAAEAADAETVNDVGGESPENTTTTPADAEPSEEAEAAIQTETIATSDTWIDKVKRDPEGNAVAIVVLLGLIASLGFVLWMMPSGGINEDSSVVRVIKLIILLAGIAVSASLLVESSGDTLAMAMSGGMLILLLWGGIAAVMGEFVEWMIPLVAGVGLLDALYLSQVEISSSEITCGLIGDCGTVQQSQYAELFGVLPVGTLGVIAYIVILLMWLVLLWNDESDYAKVGLFGMSLLGVAFSLYLTFLEPFVIGATCMWCITSALVMLLLLWLTAPTGRDALYRLHYPENRVQAAQSSV